MATLTGIRDGIRGQVAAVTTLREVYARWPKTVSAPCAMVQPSSPTVLEQITFSGGFQYSIDVVVIVPLSAGPDVAQGALDPYLDTDGESSIWAAIEADQTLDGTCSSLDITAVSAYAPLVVGDVEYESARWTVAVYV